MEPDPLVEPAAEVEYQLEQPAAVAAYQTALSTVTLKKHTHNKQNRSYDSHDISKVKNKLTFIVLQGKKVRI